MRIKMMAEYAAFPLWRLDGGGHFFPKELPLSKELVADLEAWNQSFVEQFDLNSPNHSKWDQEEWRAFDTKGYELWQRLLEELNDEYQVTYASYIFPQIFDNPEEYLRHLKDKKKL